MDAELNAQPRVNSAHLGDFIGRNVRLVCKVERVKGTSAIVRATDLGQVEVKMPQVPEREDKMKPETFVEVIASVEDANTVKMQGCISLGEDLDMDVANDCINMMHDPRFQNIF